jgi:hypothetical protein
MWNLLFAAALAVEPGDPIDRAAGLHLSARGLANLGQAVASVVPTGLDISAVETEFACDPTDADPLAFSLPSLHAGIVADAVELIPQDGQLLLRLDLGLTLEAADVAVSGNCTFLLRDVDYTCRVEAGLVEPIDLVVEIPVGLGLTPEGAIDATVGALAVQVGPIDNPLAGCRRLVDLFDTLSVLSLDSADTDTSNPAFFTELVWGFLAPELEAIPADLELALEDALAVLPIVQPLDLLGTTMEIELFPTALWIDPDGLFVGLGASVYAPWDPTCVPGDAPPAGPDAPSVAWPALADTAYGAGQVPYDAALFLGHGFVEHLGFVAWQAGLLCLDVGELSPIPLGTSLLGNLFGPTFQALFPVDQPTTMRIDAETPPEVFFPSDAALELALPGLGLDVYTALDGREDRVCRTGIDAVLGLGVEITDGALQLALDVDPARWTFVEERPDVLGPGFSAGVATGLPAILGGILTPDLLPAFALPAWQGIGVGGVEVAPAADGRWQGLFLTLDAAAAEPIVLEGCAAGCDGGQVDAGLDLGAALGCADDAGCAGCAGDGAGCEDTGCAAAGRGGLGRTIAVVAAMVVVAIRRRREPARRG